MWVRRMMTALSPGITWLISILPKLIPAKRLKT